MDERQSGAMSIRGGQIWNRMANLRGLEGAREGIDLVAKCLRFDLFFFFFFRHQLQWRCSLNKWNPFFGRRRLIDAISALCTNRNEEDDASGQSMWAVRWEQFTFIAIGHPSFGVAVVAQSTAFYMFCTSKIIENNWRCQRGVFRSIWPRAPLTPTTCHLFLDRKMKHFQRSRQWWIWWTNTKIDKRFDETARSAYLFTTYKTIGLILTFVSRSFTPFCCAPPCCCCYWI